MSPRGDADGINRAQLHRFRKNYQVDRYRLISERFRIYVELTSVLAVFNFSRCRSIDSACIASRDDAKGRVSFPTSLHL